MKVPLIHLIALLCGYFAYRDSGAHTTAFSDNNKVTSVDASVLTLSFGNTKDAQGNDTPAGFDLSANQIDLMVAFDEVDNTADDATQASLNFTHQFALVTIEAASLERRTDIRIDKIEVYGNHKATTGKMIFSYSDDSVISSWTLNPNSETKRDDLYYTISKTGGWNLTRKGTQIQYHPIGDGLLVFPEKCRFTIVVTYTECYGGNETVYTKSGTLDVDWEADKNYTYTFSIALDAISFSEPTVTPWPTESNWISIEEDDTKPEM